MKKHSKIFRIIVSFVIFTMIVFGTNLSAYADMELSITCHKALCSKKVQLCGPLLYGATIPSSVPYLGGTILNADNRIDATIYSMTTNDHFFAAYCPSYTNSGLSKHAMALFRFSHVYVAQSYAQLTDDVTSGDTTYRKTGYHLTTYKCTGSKRASVTGSIISQVLADGTFNDGYLSNDELDAIETIICAKGCNGVKQEYEHHNWSMGTWTNYDGTYHQRTNTCSDCGYTETEKSIHRTSSTDWTSISSTQHQRTTTCTVCNYSYTSKANHSWTYSNYTSVDGTKHSVKRTCSVCGYTDTIQQNHSFTYSDWTYYPPSDMLNLDPDSPDTSVYHARKAECQNCGYSKYEYDEHNIVRDFEGYRQLEPDNGYGYSPATYHYHREHCTICTYGKTILSFHKYNKNQNVYTDISDTQHHVKQTCTDCGWLKEFDENHTFKTTWEVVSETRHKKTDTCVCGHTNISYGDHHDDDSDCYCDDCGYLMTRFSVTVPATLSLVMDKDGKVYAPTNAAITNNSTAAVKVTGISLSPKNGWTVVPYSTNMANQKVDSHKIGLKLRDSQSVLGNTMPVTGNWDISKDGNLPLTYSAVVSATSQPISGTNVLDVTFVIDWRY